MPEEWSQGLSGASESRIARRIADYIAGMTDTYAVLAHRTLFEVTPELQRSPPSRGLPLTDT
jgi:dGTPase